MGWIRSTFAKPGEILTELLGLAVINKTGATIAAGTLVYVNGMDATEKLPSIAKADADVSGAKAVWVTSSAIKNGNSGRVRKAFQLGSQNTSGLTVGDKVFLSSATAGGWVAADPAATSPASRSQVVGRVHTVHLTAGVIAFDLAAHDDTQLGVVDQNPATIRYAEVVLTNAQVLALRATPVELVAAPGAGKVLEFISAVFLFDYTAAYTIVAGGDDLAVKYENGTGVIASGSIETTGWVDDTADSAAVVGPAAVVGALKTACENKALVLHNVGANELGGGDAANVVRCKVAYRVHITNW